MWPATSSHNQRSSRLPSGSRRPWGGRPRNPLHLKGERETEGKAALTVERADVEQIIDSWPKAHTDFLTQYIDYRVPPEQAHLVAMFDGSILVDRTRGEVAARCDSEAATPGGGEEATDRRTPS